MGQIKVYGTDWCHDTSSTRKYLDGLNVRYEYINIEEDEEATAWVERQNDGKQKLPTVDVAGLVLSVPSNGELDIALRRQGTAN